MKTNPINGTWVVNYIMNPPEILEKLFPNEKPKITFVSEEGKVSGYAGCNRFSGMLSIDGNKLGWVKGLALTRKMCPDMAGEQVFMQTLQGVNTFHISEDGNTLNLVMGDIAVMRLNRKLEQND